MIFLELIKGLKGEDQTSAILKYLLVNSNAFRKRFVDRIKKEFSPSNIPTFQNGLMCFTEYQSNQSEDKSGTEYIDILLVGENSLLIIENKLWAGFGSNQPKKYEDSVREIAEEKFGLREDQCRVIVLYPKQRAAYVKAELDKLKFKKPPIHLTWADIQDDLKAIRNESSESIRVISDMLCEYLDYAIGVYSELNMPKDKLVGSAVKIGNQYQRDFINRISTGSKLEDYKQTNIRFGNIFGGFYFKFRDCQKRHQNWFGFHTYNEKVTLEIHINFGKEADAGEVSSYCQLLIPASKPHYRNRYQINFEVWPADRDEWQSRIDEILDVFERATVYPEVDSDDPDDLMEGAE